MIPLGIVASAFTVREVRDSFNRPNGPLGDTDTGEPWLIVSGTWAIDSNKAVASPGGVAIVETGLLDQVVTVTGTPHSAGGPWPGLVARWSPGTFYMLHDAYLWRVTGGGYVVFHQGSWSGDRLSLECREEGANTRLIVRADGTQVWSGTDSSPTRPMGTGAGLRFDGSPATYDDFHVGPA